MTRGRVVAIVAAHNEERFIGGCLQHLSTHGVECYLIDNQSTDRTVEIASRWQDTTLVGVESFPRIGVYPWRALLARKAALAAQLDADWVLHVDADERHIPPRSGITLSDALREAASIGSNAVRFIEYTFVPTLENPDHDHQEFERTMCWYYPHQPGSGPHVRAWRPQAGAVDLVESGGHAAVFPGRRLHPVPFGMRHYLHLSAEHAVRKYARRAYDPSEIALGWHLARAALSDENIRLLPQACLRRYDGDESLDPADPWIRHPLFDPSYVAPHRSAAPG